jgi:hypothetical protein
MRLQQIDQEVRHLEEKKGERCSASDRYCESPSCWASTRLRRFAANCGISPASALERRACCRGPERIVALRKEIDDGRRLSRGGG